MKKHLLTLKWYIIVAIISIICVLYGCTIQFNPTNLITKIFAIIAFYCIATIIFYFDCKSGRRVDTW